MKKFLQKNSKNLFLMMLSVIGIISSGWCAEKPFIVDEKPGPKLAENPRNDGVLNSERAFYDQIYTVFDERKKIDPYIRNWPFFYGCFISSSLFQNNYNQLRVLCISNLSEFKKKIDELMTVKITGILRDQANISY